MGDNAARADYGAVTDLNAFQDEASASDKHIRTDPYRLVRGGNGIQFGRTDRGIERMKVSIGDGDICTNNTSVSDNNFFDRAERRSTHSDARADDQSGA